MQTLKMSFKATLRSIAKETHRDPAALWQLLTLERFLVRLARSRYATHFILKGGVLLSKYINLGRETVDLDFLAQKISNETSTLKTIFQAIAKIDLKDGFLFQNIKAHELSHLHMGYPGAQINMNAYFGKIRFKVTLDIGFGDVVNPIKKTLPLMASSKSWLFEPSVDLTCYPQAFIFAEKLQTVVYRGPLNSRMKDFHDLYSMVSANQGHALCDLSTIIPLVFKHRNTPLTLPLFFAKHDLKYMQTFWSQYLRGLPLTHAPSLPKQIVQTIKKVNDFLLTLKLP